jgi:hypothetical protein
MMIRFNQGLWYGRQCLNALGLWGLIGVGIMLFVGSFFYAKTDIPSNNHLQSSAKQASTRLQVPPSKVVSATSKQEKEAEESSSALASLLPLFPEEHRLPSILNQMHQQAKRAQLSIPSADYKWKKLKKNAPFSGANMVQYEITFLVKGSYTSIRNMLNALLAETPTMALDSLELKRESVSSPITEARVTLVVFLMGAAE